MSAPHLPGYVARAWPALLLGALLAAASCESEQPSPPEFVGVAACISCHAEAGAAWRSSHHDLAMQVAEPGAVLGAFEGDTLHLEGGTYVPVRRGDGFFVRTRAHDGSQEEVRIRYTFGVDPLQQYLVEMPGGRLQALTLAWDSRPADQGGQRWFDLAQLHEEEVHPGNPSHWTGADQNWNFMCADCHSTGVRKRYDPETDRYDTRYAELNVACEACHGPGSRHVAWAEEEGDGVDMGLPASLARHRPGAWQLNPATGSPSPRAGPDPGKQIDSCGFCHALRVSLVDDYLPGDALLDTHLPSLLEAGLYFADGQIRDEVFEWGSFLQSAMYRGGVTCSDCHDPHSLELQAPGNALCTGCHAPDRFDTAEHHLHPEGSEGAACVSCHMPSRTYMVVDPRRDHSFPIPQPMLSHEIGAPDPCTGCHVTMTPEEAQASLAVTSASAMGAARQRARAGAARAFAGAWAGVAGSSAALAEAAADPASAPIVRATALSLLGQVPDPGTAELLRAGTRSPDPVIRIGALRGLEGFPPDATLQLAFPLLTDAHLSVRTEAARILASVPSELIPPEARPVLSEALSEYRKTQWVNADRAEARVNLGSLALQQGDLVTAEEQYRTALRLEPGFSGGYVNLADLLRILGRDEEGERILRTGLERTSNAPELKYALALALVRLGRTSEAVPLLREASEDADGSARFAYVYAVALHSGGAPERAVEWLDAFLERHPGNREALLGLAEIQIDLGDREEALGALERLLELDPSDPAALRLRAAARALSP